MRAFSTHTHVQAVNTQATIVTTAVRRKTGALSGLFISDITARVETRISEL